MKKQVKREAVLLSEVAISSEVTILETDGTVKRVGQYRDMFAETTDHDRFYLRLALLIKEKRILIID